MQFLHDFYYNNNNNKERKERESLYITCFASVFRLNAGGIIMRQYYARQSSIVYTKAVQICFICAFIIKFL